jgi:ABC-type antimicrobial peptide transport system permease subunit
VALGLHSAASINHISGQLIGNAGESVIPWGHVAGGVALTVGICLLAGIVPARYAARNNIVDAIASQ